MIIQITGAKTDLAPAVVGTDFGGGNKIFVAWVNPADSGIWYAFSTDNVHWSAPALVQEGDWYAQTDQGPALVLSTQFSGPGQLMYVAWKQKGTNEIRYSATSDGVSWKPPGTVPGAFTNSKPALGQNTIGGTGGPLAVAWRALNNSIQYILSPSGISPAWSAITPVNGAESNVGPGLGSTQFDNGQLVFSWTDKNNILWYEFSTTPTPTAVKGSGFTSKSTAAPSVPNQVNTLGLAWQGDGDTSIWVSKEFPNPPLTQQSVAGVATDVAPAWLGVGGLLVFKKAGESSLWTCTP